MRTPAHEVLEELALFALESDSSGTKYEYTDSDITNASIIFSSVMGTLIFDLGMKEEMPFEIMKQQATAFGEELRQLIKKFTDKDMHEIARK